MNEAMESLPSKLAAMAVASVAKADAAEVDEGVPGESKSYNTNECLPSGDRCSRKTLGVLAMNSVRQ